MSTQPTGFAGPDRDSTSRACLDLVEEYRNGTISRARATMSIGQALIGALSAEAGEESVDKALESYLQMLAEVDQEGETGRPGSQAGETRDQPEQPRERTRGGSVDFGHGSVRQPTPVAEPNAEPERERADPSKYAWASSGATRALFLSDNLRATVELLQQYTVNVKRAKRDLLLTIGAPEFPSAEWDNILRGLPVDLDRVLSGMYSTTDNDKEVAQLGPYKVTAPRTQAARRTSGKRAISDSMCV
ncbi:hypothetical protein EVJ58_g9701 [Rhodofomes roseus]|uniref:Uncharacterized protein n=1 Tax=Rhodofomes roseus TaxID=34475 RepID=A0A4Y9XS69_9APHY|nr:hypothetical protein EVJ58_g9701 [Rhodofomes roseus]